MKEKFCNSNTSGSSKVKSLHCNAQFLFLFFFNTIMHENHQKQKLFSNTDTKK